MRKRLARRIHQQLPLRWAVKRSEKLQRLLLFVADTCDAPENAGRLQGRVLRQHWRGRLALCRSFCLLSGRSHSVYRHFRLSRHQVRVLAHRGQIYGLRKASW